MTRLKEVFTQNIQGVLLNRTKRCDLQNPMLFWNLVYHCHTNHDGLKVSDISSALALLLPNTTWPGSMDSGKRTRSGKRIERMVPDEAAHAKKEAESSFQKRWSKLGESCFICIGKAATGSGLLARCTRPSCPISVHVQCDASASAISAPQPADWLCHLCRCSPDVLS